MKPRHAALPSPDDAKVELMQLLQNIIEHASFSELAHTQTCSNTLCRLEGDCVPQQFQTGSQDDRMAVRDGGPSNQRQ